MVYSFACPDVILLCKYFYGVHNDNTSMQTAAQNGHADIIRLYHSMGMQNFDDAISVAAKSGNVDVFRLCISLQRLNNAPRGQICSIFDGVNTIDIPIKSFTSRLEESMAFAPHRGHFGVFRICQFYGAKQFGIALCFAARGGQLEMMKLCYSLCPANMRVDVIDRVIKNAAYFGEKDAVLLCLAWNSKHCTPPWTGYKAAMLSASGGGHNEIIRLCLDLCSHNHAVDSDWGFNFFNRCMIFAAGNGHVETVQLLHGLGADNFDGAIESAACNSQRAVVNMLIKLRQP